MIKSALQSSLTNDVKYRSMSAGAVPSNEYLIQTAITTTSPTQVIFDVTGFGSQFRHLRLVTSVKGSGGLDGYNMQFNGDTGANYAAHVLYGNGSQVLSAVATSATFFSIGLGADVNEAGVFHVSDVDILDAFNPNKNTTSRILVGARGVSSPFVQLRSGLWMNTSPLTSIRVYPNSGTFANNCRISLYGVTA
jgi:hypothetical protein